MDAESTHAVDIATFTENMESIFNLLNQYKAQVIAYGLTPVDEARTSPIVIPSTTISRYFKNSRIKQFENALMQTAKTSGATTIPIFEQAIQESWSSNYLYEDGLHPNTKGHAWLSEKIRPHLWQLLNLK